MPKRIALTRQELYEKVWTLPASKLSKELGMSDVGLGKLCNRLKIPKPGLGYWAKIAHGQLISRPPLPAVDDLQAKEIEFVIKDELPKSESIELDEFFRTELERIHTINIPPPKTDVKMIKNPLLLDLRKIKPEPYRPWEGWIRTGRHSFAWFNIPKESLERGLLLLDSFLTASELCGFRLKAKPEGPTYLQVLGAEISMAIREKSRQVEIIPKPRPKEVFSPVGESTMTHVSLGRMSLTIMDSRYGILRAYLDRHQRAKLEEMIPPVH